MLRRILSLWSIEANSIGAKLTADSKRERRYASTSFSRRNLEFRFQARRPRWKLSNISATRRQQNVPFERVLVRHILLVHIQGLLLPSWSVKRLRMPPAMIVLVHHFLALGSDPLAWIRRLTDRRMNSGWPRYRGGFFRSEGQSASRHRNDAR